LIEDIDEQICAEDGDDVGGDLLGRAAGLDMVDDQPQQEGAGEKVDDGVDDRAEKIVAEIDRCGAPDQPQGEEVVAPDLTEGELLFLRFGGIIGLFSAQAGKQREGHGVTSFRRRQMKKTYRKKLYV